MQDLHVLLLKFKSVTPIGKREREEVQLLLSEVFDYNINRNCITYNEKNITLQLPGVYRYILQQKKEELKERLKEIGISDIR